MLTLHVSPKHPEPRKIAQVVESLSRGGVALYPTDTVYALGCALDAKKTIPRLYQLKRMDEHQLLAMMVADLSEVSRYAVVTDFAYRQMRRLLPGPYTIVLEATREVPRLLLGKQRTIGLRVPDNAICDAMLRALGQPILTSSAVPFGAERAVMDAEEGKEVWPKGIDVVVDGDLCPGEPSTVVSLVGDEIDVIREGLGKVEGVLT